MLSLKLYQKSRVRRVGIKETVTYDELCETLTSVFSVQLAATRPGILYRDDEGDWVHCNSQSEFDEALRIAKQTTRIIYVKPQENKETRELKRKAKEEKKRSKREEKATSSVQEVSKEIADPAPVSDPSTEDVPDAAQEVTFIAEQPQDTEVIEYSTTPTSSHRSWPDGDGPDCPDWAIVGDNPSEPSVTMSEAHSEPGSPANILDVAVDEVSVQVSPDPEDTQITVEGLNVEVNVNACNVEVDVDVNTAEAEAPAEVEVEAHEMGTLICVQPVATPSDQKWAQELKKLEEMGFYDSVQAIELLERNRGDMVKVVEAILSM